MDDCVFCKIIRREIQSNIIFESEEVIAINDINPQAPVHVLIIPKKHYATLNDVTDPALHTKVFEAVGAIVKAKGIKDSGYRVVVNCNQEGGQVVFHLHFHVLGGRQMLGTLG